MVGTDDADGSKIVTAATTFTDIQTTVEEVLTALGENCLNKTCSYTALLKSTVNNKMGESLNMINTGLYSVLCISETGWSSIAPTATKIKDVFDTLLEKIKTDVRTFLLFFLSNILFLVPGSL